VDDTQKGKGVTVSPSQEDPEILLKHELDRLRVPEADKERILLLTMRAHSGPLPPADEFAHYGHVEASAPRTILDMAERQQKHDHWMDKWTLISEASYRVLTIVAAAVIILGMVYLGYSLIMAGHEGAGAALLALGPLATIAQGFIRGRNMTRMQDHPQPEPQQAEKRPSRNRGKRK
jgi:uncharacterized membrane protein